MSQELEAAARTTVIDRHNDNDDDQQPSSKAGEATRQGRMESNFDWSDNDDDDDEEEQFDDTYVDDDEFWKEMDQSLEQELDRQMQELLQEQSRELQEELDRQIQEQLVRYIGRDWLSELEQSNEEPWSTRTTTDIPTVESFSVAASRPAATVDSVNAAIQKAIENYKHSLS